MSLAKECWAICIKIDDDCQYFMTDHDADHCKQIYLCGIDKAKDVKVGDKGKMIYQSTGSRGWWSFIKDR